MITRNKNMLLSVTGLILLDQIIKLYIASRYMEANVDILRGILGFRPYINEYYSWINSLFNMGISWVAHILLNVIIILLAFVTFGYVRRKNPGDRYVSWIFRFLFAGTSCSLIDKLFWGGSLDYIWLKGFFIFDLKDVYLTIFNILLITSVLINYKGMRDISTRKVLTEMFLITKHKLLRRPR